MGRPGRRQQTSLRWGAAGQTTPFETPVEPRLVLALETKIRETAFKVCFQGLLLRFAFDSNVWRPYTWAGTPTLSTRGGNPRKASPRRRTLGILFRAAAAAAAAASEPFFGIFSDRTQVMPRVTEGDGAREAEELRRSLGTLSLAAAASEPLRV